MSPRAHKPHSRGLQILFPEAPGKKAVGTQELLSGALQGSDKVPLRLAPLLCHLPCAIAVYQSPSP
jgi:hypothetical protein